MAGISKQERRITETLAGSGRWRGLRCNPTIRHEPCEARPAPDAPGSASEERYAKCLLRLAGVLQKGKGRVESRRGSDLDRLDGLQVLSRVRVESMPEVPVALTVEPELRRRPKETRESKGGIRGDSSLGVDDLVDAREGDVDPLGQLGLGHPDWLEELLQQHLARMGRGAVLGKHDGSLS